MKSAFSLTYIQFDYAFIDVKVDHVSFSSFFMEVVKVEKTHLSTFSTSICCFISTSHNCHYVN